MLKKITICILVSLFTLSCVSQNYGFHIPKNSRDQFARILQDTSLTICLDGACNTKTFKSSGSGVVVASSEEGSYVLTAAHVCQVEIMNMVPDPNLLSLIKRIEINMNIVNLSQSKYEADVISLDTNSDMCLLFILSHPYHTSYEV